MSLIWHHVPDHKLNTNHQNTNMTPTTQHSVTILQLFHSRYWLLSSVPYFQFLLKLIQLIFVKQPSLRWTRRWNETFSIFMLTFLNMLLMSNLSGLYFLFDEWFALVYDNLIFKSNDVPLWTNSLTICWVIHWIGIY